MYQSATVKNGSRRPNGPADRLSPKQEAVYLHEITDGFQAKRIIDDWIEFRGWQL